MEIKEPLYNGWVEVCFFSDVSTITISGNLRPQFLDSMVLTPVSSPF